MNTPINDGGPAFPGIDSSRAARDSYGNTYTSINTYDGMTLRDWFAGQALIGELASTTTLESAQACAEAAVKAGRDVALHIAMNSYEIADAMIAAREVKP